MSPTGSKLWGGPRRHDRRRKRKRSDAAGPVRQDRFHELFALRSPERSGQLRLQRVAVLTNDDDAPSFLTDVGINAAIFEQFQEVLDRIVVGVVALEVDARHIQAALGGQLIVVSVDQGLKQGVGAGEEPPMPRMMMCLTSSRSTGGLVENAAEVADVAASRCWSSNFCGRSMKPARAGRISGGGCCSSRSVATWLRTASLLRDRLDTSRRKQVLGAQLGERRPFFAGRRISD